MRLPLEGESAADPFAALARNKPRRAAAGSASLRRFSDGCGQNCWTNPLLRLRLRITDEEYVYGFVYGILWIFMIFRKEECMRSVFVHAIHQHSEKRALSVLNLDGWFMNIVIIIWLVVWNILYFPIQLGMA